MAYSAFHWRIDCLLFLSKMLPNCFLFSSRLGLYTSNLYFYLFLFVKWLSIKLKRQKKCQLYNNITSTHAHTRDIIITKDKGINMDKKDTRGERERSKGGD